MNNTTGKFIVFYGLNNLGKTTQAKLLVENLNRNGMKAVYTKYPNYDVMPTGKLIQDYLREGNSYGINPREIQILYAFNREQCEKDIKESLADGIHVISECYIGTGLAWGEANDVDKNFLRHINSHLLKEDLAFYFKGERFRGSIEKNHVFENDNNLSNKARIAFEFMSQEFGWVDINANNSIREIERTIYAYVIEFISNAFAPFHSPDFKYLSNKAQEQKTFNQTIKPGDRQSGVTVRRLSPLAKIPDSSNRYTYNLYAHGYYSIAPGKSEHINTGIKLFLPNNFIAIVSSNLGHFSCVINSNNDGEVKIFWHNSTLERANIRPGQIVGHVVFQKISDPSQSE